MGWGCTARWRRVLVWVFPQRCCLCSTWVVDEWLCCHDCRRRLLRRRMLRAQKLKMSDGLPSSMTGRTEVCELKSQSTVRVWSPTREMLDHFLEVDVGLAYEGPVRQLILTIKCKGQEVCAYQLGVMAIQAGMIKLGEGWVVPMPSDAARLRQRGFNPAACMASGMVGALERNQDLKLNWLKKRHQTPKQSTLSRDERWAQMRDAMVWCRKSDGKPVHEQCGDDVDGRPIVLIDDVVTTGATLNAAVRAIHAVEPGLQIKAVCMAGVRCVDHVSVNAEWA